MNRYITPTEAENRLAAVGLIEDADLREKVVDTICEFPKYFWQAPATSSDQYHNRFARGEYGLWIHTAMAATALERTIESYVQQNRILQIEADYARAAVLIHDGRKYGSEWNPGESADKDHDLQMADVAREKGFSAEVVDAIAAHMGPWYDGPQPSWVLEQAVHQADMTASARHVTPAVYDPPQCLIEKYPDLPRCSPGDPSPSRGGDTA